MTLRRFAALVAALGLAACTPEADNASLAKKAERAPTLQLTPTEFAGGAQVGAHGGFRQATALADTLPCPQPPNNGGRVVQTEPHYDVAFVTLDDTGKETNTFTAPSSGFAYDRSIPSGTWVDHDFTPVSLPPDLNAERLRVALRFGQRTVHFAGNACTDRPGESNIVQYDYRLTCAGDQGQPGARRCRYVLDQGG